MNCLHQLKLNLDNNNMDCDELISKCIEQFSNSKQNMRGLVTLLIRYYIAKNNIDEINKILYNDNLMKRDYLTMLDYYLTFDNNYDSNIKYIYKSLNELETKDVDLLIKNNWTDLLKQFDGYMVLCSYESNVTDTTKLKKYNFDVSILKDKYNDRIKNKEEIDEKLKHVDVLIDGANLSHLGKEFDFSILSKLISKFNKLGLRAKIILHERHNINIENIKPYLIRTPTLRNDDDYMIYGMLSHNLMVLSNDRFRDHVKNMDGYTKCYVNSMRIRYYNNNIIIPKYSICIQVIDNDIYIPCKKGFYKL
jgi:hypothetical protein